MPSGPRPEMERVSIRNRRAERLPSPGSTRVPKTCSTFFLNCAERLIYPSWRCTSANKGSRSAFGIQGIAHNKADTDNANVKRRRVVMLHAGNHGNIQRATSDMQCARPVSDCTASRSCRVLETSLPICMRGHNSCCEKHHNERQASHCQTSGLGLKVYNRFDSDLPSRISAAVLLLP